MEYRKALSSVRSYSFCKNRTLISSMALKSGLLVQCYDTQLYFHIAQIILSPPVDRLEEGIDAIY